MVPAEVDQVMGSLLPQRCKGVGETAPPAPAPPVDRGEGIDPLSAVDGVVVPCGLDMPRGGYKDARRVANRVTTFTFMEERGGAA